jgi:hypothetical protein
LKGPVLEKVRDKVELAVEPAKLAREVAVMTRAIVADDGN